MAAIANIKCGLGGVFCGFLVCGFFGFVFCKFIFFFNSSREGILGDMYLVNLFFVAKDRVRF